MISWDIIILIHHLAIKLIGGIKIRNIQSILTFVDFKKAFDIIDREVIFILLKIYEIQEILIRDIQSLHTDTKEQIISAKTFLIQNGIL